ncbi:MAG TPA: DsbA family protein [Anaerolineales bacterium]|jgi:protein-disulfide isomerase|nr:DsbA family protein [Anaerolineales bacterium]
MAKKRPKSGKQLIRERRQARQKRQRWLTIGVGVLAFVAVAGFVLWPRPKAEPVDPARLVDDPSLGPAGAPVTIVEYGDFGCPSCRAWYQAGILDQIRAKYDDEVRFVWRDFPIITAQSPKAAEAAQCAYDQGKFWQYHDLLYDRAPALSVDDLKAYAAEIGLDTVQFNQCLDSGQHRETVRHDWDEALALHLRGTPSFLINDQLVAGPPTFEYLQQMINSILG